MYTLLIDFEATSVDPSTARIIEVGAMLVDESWKPVKEVVSTLVWESGYPALTAEVEKVTNISQDLLCKQGKPFSVAMDELGSIAKHADYAIAFNSSYDETLFKAEMKRNNLDTVHASRLLFVPWLCAMSDLEKNYEFKSWRLMHVALEYGVTVNPKILHRAIADVELMRQVLVESGYSVHAINAFRQTPWIYVEADVKKPWTDGGESAAEAKKLGYSWERARGDDRVHEKKWVKRIKADKLEQELNLPIKVRRVQ